MIGTVPPTVGLAFRKVWKRCSKRRSIWLALNRPRTHISSKPPIETGSSSMQPESRKLLADALGAAIAIEAFAAHKALSDLETDSLLRSGSYWQFAIIGESLARLRKLDENTFDRISESPRIVAFRNQLLHGYDVIQHNVTWQI